MPAKMTQGITNSKFSIIGLHGLIMNLTDDCHSLTIL